METDNSGSSTPISIPTIQPLSHDWGHSVQFMLRWPCIYCPEQIMQQTAWEIDHPISDQDFGDRGDLRSCDSIDSPIHTRVPCPSQCTRPFTTPMPIDSMNLNHLRDQRLSVPPPIRPDMRDAIRPSPLEPLYPGIGDHPRSTLRLSRTHCLQAPSDEIA